MPERDADAIRRDIHDKMLKIIAELNAKTSELEKEHNTIIDIYEGNKLTDLDALINSGVVAIIHKASEGLTTDTAYASRRTNRTLWGAYHFMRPGSGVAQADFFIYSAKPDLHTLMALDLEDRTIPLAEVEAFATTIHTRLGRWPVLYTSAGALNPLRVPKQSPLMNCFLWVASYGTKDEPTLPKGWLIWSLWQYNGAASRPGVSSCDLNRFNGSQLSSWWAS